MGKIIYITSAKTGLHAFTYKELELLEKNNIEFFLCLTQLKKGAFNPKNSWEIYIPSKNKLILGLIFHFFSAPRKTSQLLLESIKDRTLIYFLIAINFAYVLKAENLSSIHCQMGDHKLNIGYYLSKIINKKLTTTVHAHELYSKTVYSNIAQIKKLFNHCEKIITISEFNKNELVERIGINADKICIMYLYPTNFNKHFYEKKKILIVANWFFKKGYGFLLRSLSQLQREDFELWAVVEATESETSINLNELIEEFDLGSKVKVFGAQPKIVLDVLFSACDIFCLPSITDHYPDNSVREREGIPVALMEAMSWEKPVISTNHAGIPELIGSHLVNENDITDLCDKINYLLDHPELYEKKGKENKIAVEKKFTESNIDILINELKKLG